MSARTRLFAAALTLSFASFIPTPSFAQDQTPPEVENGNFKVAGVVNANAVYVRSGPGDNYYPTLKLDKGTRVTIVGKRFDWLKIVPPEGSFCYVAKAYVEKYGDGSVGRVTKPNLNVRAGSTLNAMKTTVQLQLDSRVDVKILGEQDEYFKIAPPDGAYLYISKQYVEPEQVIAPIAEADAQEPVAANNPAALPEVAGDTSDPVASDPVLPTAENATADNATADNAVGDNAVAVTDAPDEQPGAVEPTELAVAPSTQPVALSGAALFDKLEADYLAAADLPLAEQSIDEMLGGFESLVAGKELPESMRRIAEHRVATLKIRQQAREELIAVRKSQEEFAQRRLVLQVEQEELRERIRQNEVQLFTAVGTLQISSLQQGPQTLYRLTDPATTRTVLYIRSDDPVYAGLVGEFIGVTGDIAIDQQLKVLTPTKVEPVDQSLVNTRVIATITPPSLLPTGVTASTNE